LAPSGKLAQTSRSSRPFCRRSLGEATEFAWLAFLVNGDKGEFGLGHLDPLALTLAQHPHLDIEGDQVRPMRATSM